MAVKKRQQTLSDQERTIAEHERTIAEQKRTIAEQIETITDHANAIRVRDTLYLEAGTILKALFQLLTKLVELRDPYTRGHSQRVTELSLALAEQNASQFPEDKLTVLRYAALLHDIGKIAINDFVLSKATLLTEVERAMIQQHTVMGHKLISPLDLDPLIAAVILHHHENYDGTGYPSGLKGEQIPLAARIVKVADVYDALTSNRPYRIAYTPEQAIKVMSDNQHEFDPLLFDILRKMMTKHLQ